MLCVFIIIHSIYIPELTLLVVEKCPLSQIFKKTFFTKTTKGHVPAAAQLGIIQRYVTTLIIIDNDPVRLSVGPS